MELPSTTVNSRPDGVLLHFLKELPGWVVVSGALLFFTAIYMVRADDFIPRILDALIGAFLGLVVAQRPRPTSATQITTGTVETPIVNADSITDSTVNTENLNLENKEKN